MNIAEKIEEVMSMKRERRHTYMVRDNKWVSTMGLSNQFKKPSASKPKSSASKPKSSRSPVDLWNETITPGLRYKDDPKAMQREYYRRRKAKERGQL